MNKYIVPIYDEVENNIKIKVLSATSLINAQEKLINYLINTYEFDTDNFSDYQEFINYSYDAYNLLIGEILDIEEI